MAGTLTDLLLAAGPAARALHALASATLTPTARELAQRLAETAEAIQSRAPGLKLTIDPVEFRGLKYHTGVCVTIYATGRHEELGRGGRYICGDNEPATGLTIYPDAVLRAAPAHVARPRCYVPLGGDGSALREAGHITVAALAADPDPRAEAVRLGCTHILIEGRVTALQAE